jgi:hypothetical protein
MVRSNIRFSGLQCSRASQPASRSAARHLAQWSRHDAADLFDAALGGGDQRRLIDRAAPAGGQ